MKTSELTGAALDAAVAICEGHRLNGPYTAFDGAFCLQEADGSDGDVCPAYSTDRTQGGSIIDREDISTVLLYGTTWGATTYNVRDIVLDRNEAHYQGIGPTRLIAAMRCFVASKFGDEVELPKELI